MQCLFRRAAASIVALVLVAPSTGAGAASSVTLPTASRTTPRVVVAAANHQQARTPVKEPSRHPVRALPASAIRANVAPATHVQRGIRSNGPPLLRLSAIGRLLNAAHRHVQPVVSAPTAARRQTAVPGRTVPSAGRGTSSLPSDSSASGTGINPWWRYQEESLPGGGRDIVNIGTGNLLVQDLDMNVPHKGVALAFQRTYNSQSQHDVTGTDGAQPSLYGNGWTNTFDAHITGSSTGMITVWDIDGTRYDYHGNNTAGWTPPAGQHAYLSYDGTCGYVWLKKSGTLYYFYAPDAASCSNGFAATYGAYLGRLALIAGRNWNTYVTFAYSWDNGNTAQGGKVSAITAQTESGLLAATLSFADVAGHRLLQQIVFPDGMTSVRYAYDAAGNLVSVSKPPNNAGGNQPVYQPVLTYGYQTLGAGSVISWAASPRWNASGGADGGYAAFWFAGTSVPTSTLSTIAHVANVNPAITDGVTTSALQAGWPTAPFQYLTEYYTTGVTTPTLRDTNGHMTNWVVDGAGRPTQTQQCTASAAQGQSCTGKWLITIEAWDANDNLVSETDARGNQSDFAYDANGNAVAVASPAVTVTTAGGSVRFRPTQLFDYDGFNNVVAFCDQRATHAASADWAAGPPTAGAPDNLCSSATPVHASYVYGGTAGGYEPWGELTQIRNPLGYAHTISYDIAAQGGSLDYGLPTAVRGDAVAESDGTMQPYVAMYYDSSGNVVCTLADAGTNRSTTVATYDVLNRPTAVADPDDSSVAAPALCPGRMSDISGSTIVSRKTYFPDGSLASVQTPAESAANVSRTYQYDLDGNVVQEQQHHTPAAGPIVKYYDGADRLVQVVEPQDPIDFYSYPWLTRYLYDLTQGGSNSVAGSAPFPTYGAMYKTQERLPGAVADWYATGVGTSTSGSGMILDTSAAAFDALDRPVAKFRNTGNGLETISNVYDSASSGDGELSSTCNALSECTTFVYDERGQVIQKSFNVGSSTTEQFSYDENGRAATAANGVGSTTDAYDADGRQTSRLQTTGTGPTSAIAYHYYANGLRSALDIALSNGTNYPNAITYTYRNDGMARSVGVMGAAGRFQFGYTGGRRFLSRGDSTGVGPFTYSYGAVGQSSASATGYPAVGLPTGINAPSFYEVSIHYDAEGGYFTGDNWIYMNGGFYGDSVPQYKKTSRGEAYSNYETVKMANGVRIPIYSLAAGSSPHYEWNPLQGFPVDYANSTRDTDTAYSFDAVGRHVGGTDVNGTGDTYTKQYDAEDHLLRHLVASGPIGRNQKRWSLDYRWGPTAHPFAIGSSSVVATTSAPPTDFQYDSLYWDNDTLLFTVNSAGQVDDIKIVDFADYIPGTSTPLVVIDRDNIGQIRDCHRNGGGGAVPANTASVKAITCPMTPAQIPSRTGPYFVGRGAILVQPKSDGFTDGFNTFQGVRTYDPQAGVWNTPDAYRGSVHDPMSRKPYMWNRNNPFQYEDPDGYDARDAGIKVYDFLIGDDIKTLRSNNSSGFAKGLAVVGVLSWVALPAKPVGIAIKAIQLAKLGGKGAEAYRTVAIIRGVSKATGETKIIVGSSFPLSKAQQEAIYKLFGEDVIGAAGARGQKMHAEEAALRAAEELGIIPTEVLDVSRPICGPCEEMLQQSLFVNLSPPKHI